MSENINALKAADKLRRKAETQLYLQIATTETIIGEIEARRFLYKLEVQQVELEMQNEELHRALSGLGEHKAHFETL